MNVFISGPMTANRATFDAEAARLRALGHIAINPFDLEYPSDDFEACMSVALASLRQCDAISMLPGWEFAPGAVIEYEAALRLGLRVMLPSAEQCAALRVHMERAAQMEVSMKMLLIAYAVDQSELWMERLGVGRVSA